MIIYYYYCHLHFADEETEAHGLKKLAKIETINKTTR